MNDRVLIVDLEPSRARNLSTALSGVYACTLAASVDEALRSLVDGEWFAIVAQFDLEPDFSGIEVLQEAREVGQTRLRLLYVDSPSPGLIREAQRHAHVHAVLDSAARDFGAAARKVLDEARHLPEATSGAAGEDVSAAWCAAAPATKRFLEDLRRAARSEGPVFIHGEPGSGKKLAAETLQLWRAEWRARAHSGSRRPKRETVVAEAPEAGSRGPIMILEVPPLRDRPQDIGPLSTRILAGAGRSASRPAKQLAADALIELTRRPWRENVAELRALLLNASQRAGANPIIKVNDLPPERMPYAGPTQTAKESGQRKAVLRQLRTTGAVRSAARLAGLTRPNFMRLMKRLGIMRADTAMSEVVEGETESD